MGRAWVVLPPAALHSPRRENVLVVLGQHFFNQTTDVTQTFGIEKYIPYPMYSVFNPSDHDLGKAWDMLGCDWARDVCAPCTAQASARSEAGGRRQGDLGRGEGRDGAGKEREGGRERGRGGQQGNLVRQSGLGLVGGRPGWLALLSPGPALLLRPALPGHSPSAPAWTPMPQADLWSLSRPVLIRLKKRGDRCAVRSQFVQPICLPEPSSPFPAGHKCQIAGWGHQDESEWGWGHGAQGSRGQPQGAPPSLRAPCPQTAVATPAPCGRRWSLWSQTTSAAARRCTGPTSAPACCVLATSTASPTPAR